MHGTANESTECRGWAEGFNGRARPTPCQRKAGPSGYCTIHSPEGEAKRRAKAEERDAARVAANRAKFAKERAIRALLLAALTGEDMTAPVVTLRALLNTAEVSSVRIA